MTTANSTAATLTATTRRDATESRTPQRWALVLAVVALLGLAILVTFGAELGTGIQTAAASARIVTGDAVGALDASVAGIRWVR